MKKLISLFLALAMILMVGAAFATGDGTGEGGETPAATGDGTGDGEETPAATGGTLTINRDSSWDSTAESKKATYTYYKIFDAVITTAASVTEDTGALSGNGVVVYTISGENAAAKVAALPTIFKADLASDGKYYITLADSTTTAATIVAALKTMVDANTTLFPGTAVTSDTNPVVITGLSDAYYLISASNGKDLAVQTIGNVTINEKNDYPTVSKEQKKAADPDYTEAVIPAEIGTYANFQVTVHIPTDATKSISVFDKMSAGLDYDDTTGLTLNPNIAYAVIGDTDEEYDSTADWQIRFSKEVIEANRGADVVITYRALITADALTDTGRDNEVTLNYDDDNYTVKDKTEYTTYFGGIEKVDGADKTKKLEGVVFTVTVGGAAFNVTKSGDYYIPGGSSNEVTTDANGLIVIRGLDNTKTYTLTEKSTVAGYNLLKDPKDLTLEEDKGTAYEAKDNYDQILNNQGAELPSTGGIGTTIFYVVGGLLLVGAAIVLVARRKANN